MKSFMNDYTILIVEDDEINTLYFEEILTNYDLDYILSKTGEEAVKEIKTNKNIDLVLMDIKLPNMDGYTATKEIKQFNPDIPIIAQTAHAMLEDKENALNAGCDDYITKPIFEKDLIEMLEKYLKKKKVDFVNSFLNVIINSY